MQVNLSGIASVGNVFSQVVDSILLPSNCGNGAQHMIEISACETRTAGLKFTMKIKVEFNSLEREKSS